MKRNWIFIIMLSIAVSGCEIIQKKGAAPQATFNESEFQDLGLFIEGRRIDQLDPDVIAPPDADIPARDRQQQILNHPAILNLAGFLQLVLSGAGDDKMAGDDNYTENCGEKKCGDIDLADEGDRVLLRSFIASVEQGETNASNTPVFLRGVEGISTLMAFEAYLDLTNIDGPIRPPTTKGKIRDYVYNDATKSGHLSVEMRKSYFNLAGILYKQRIRHWDIEVAGVYNVHTRNGDENSPTDPFPNAVQLSSFMTNPLDLRSVWARGLDHQLLAKGRAGIAVRHVYEMVVSMPNPPYNAGNPYQLKETFKRLPDSGPNRNSVYETTEDSCVDIFFAEYPPALHLPPQIGYCLGRCDHPEIINSR